MSKQWNDDLRRRMEQYEASAPDDLFDDIMSALPAEAPTAPVVRLWPRRIAIAAAIAIAIAIAIANIQVPSSRFQVPGSKPSAIAIGYQPSFKFMLSLSS